MYKFFQIKYNDSLSNIYKNFLKITYIINMLFCILSTIVFDFFIEVAFLIIYINTIYIKNLINYIL